MATKRAGKTRTSRSAPKSKSKPSAPGQADSFVVRYDRVDYVVGRRLAQLRVYFRVPKLAHIEPTHAAMERLLQRVGPEQLTWYRRYDHHECKRFDARALADLRRYLARKRKQSSGMSIMRVSCDDELRVLGHAPERSVELELHPRGSLLYSSRASSMCMTVPAAEVDEAAWLAELVALCEALPVLTAAAGPVLAEGDMAARDPAVLEAMRAALRDDARLGLPDGFGHRLVGPERWLERVGWLTAIGRPGIGALGGLRKLRAALSDEIEIHEAEHAVVFRLAPSFDCDVRLYREFYALVEPLLAAWLERVGPDAREFLTRLAR